MKTRDEILQRLKTLRHRFVKKAARSSQERRPMNCVHNEEHHPIRLPTTSPETELDVAPRQSKTLVVIQPDLPIRLCMYGSEDPSIWSGSICDDELTPQRCPMFKPRMSVIEAESHAESLLADDDWVFTNMKDVAALQWVLGDRVYKHELTLSQRIGRWFLRRFTKVVPALPHPEDPPDISSDIWSDSDDSSLNPRE